MKKMTLISLVGLLLSGSQAFASPSLPSLECLDGTFAYNKLQTEVQGDQLHVTVSGYPMWMYQNLVSNAGPERIVAEFSVPLDSCLISAAEPTIFSCHVKRLTVQVRTLDTDKFKKDLDIWSASIRLRKVVEASRDDFWPADSIGYELAIVERESLRWLQRYFKGWSGDEAGNCKEK